MASFENSERFGWHLWQQASRCGLREAQQVVYLTDAAGWIRTEHNRHFGLTTFIIDCYHASARLFGLAARPYLASTQKQLTDAHNSEQVGCGMA